MSGVDSTLVSLAGTPWALLVIAALCLIDGFFPPLPSESVIIAAVAIVVADGQTGMLPVIALAAMAGATCGDSIAYLIGRKVDVRRRMPFFRRGKGAQVLGWAERALTAASGPLILAARYVPVGRVAVNMTAGAVHYRYRTFVAWDVLACAAWAIYTTVIGYLSGSWLSGHPLWGAVLGIIAGILLGLALSRVVAAWSNRRANAGEGSDR